MLEGIWNRARLSLLFLWVVALLAFLPRIVAADPVEGLKRREQQVQKVCRQVMDAVVSVNGASGVIISEDGLILSQHHVSHLGPEGPLSPGHRVSVIFQDGRETEGELLGADRECDLSLLKLVGKGPYPFVAVDPAAAVDLGDIDLQQVPANTLPRTG